MKYTLIENEKAIVSVQGSLNLMRAVELKQELLDVIEQGCIKVLFDFKRTTYIDSTGIGVVISVMREAESKGGEVNITNPTGDVLTSFRAANLLDTLLI